MTRTLVFTALTLLGVTGAAIAGRPLQTEDAGVLGTSECETETVSSRESGGGSADLRETSLQIGCGIGWRTQLAIAGARARGADGRSDALAVVGKTWLRELTDAQTGLTVAYAFTSGRAAGGSYRYQATEVKAVVSSPLAADWLLHANLGVARDRTERRSSTIWSAAIERTGIGPFDLMAEAFGDDRQAPWWNTGLRYTAIDRCLFLDASYGARMQTGRRKLVTVGLKYAF